MDTDKSQSFKFGIFFAILGFCTALYLVYRCFYPDLTQYNIYTDLYLNIVLIFLNVVQGVGILKRKLYGLFFVYLNVIVNIIILPIFYYLIYSDLLFMAMYILYTAFVQLPISIIVIIYFYRRRHMFI